MWCVARLPGLCLRHIGLCACFALLSASLIGCGGDGGGPSGETTTTVTTTTSTIPTPDEPLYSCKSTLELSGAKSMARKGMCLDDTTFQQCAENITALWPHTDHPVTSIRMFKPWQPDWGDDIARRKAWGVLAAFVHKNNATVLIGAEVTCNATHDDAVWNWTLELMQVLGPEHIMGVAFGNELELLFQKTGVKQDCVEELWGGGRYFDTLVSRAEDMDRNEAFKSVKLTSVFGAYCLAGFPFVDSPVSQVLTYLRKAWQKYGDRWAWSFNVYPFWDNKCGGAFPVVPAVMKKFRERVAKVTGGQNATLWMTETGWSSSPPQYYNQPCPGYCSPERLQAYYESFLQWDVGTAVDGDTDHAFYFTMRDARNFDITESFGLVGTCQNTSCKLQKNETPVVRLPKNETLVVI